MFREVQDNLWLIEFADGEDKRRVLEGRPWSFEHKILVLQDFDGKTTPAQMNFHHSAFWVQIHNIYLVCMTKKVGARIGESLGDLVDIEVEGDGTSWGRYLHVRVNINLTKPLERGRTLIWGRNPFGFPFDMRNFPCSASTVVVFYMAIRGAWSEGDGEVTPGRT